MCPDIWRSLTLNSRYASPVKKKGNAEKSEACVDLAKKSSSHPSYRKTIFNISEISLSLRSKSKKKMFEIIYIYIYNYNSQNIEISIPIFLDPLPFLVLQLHPSKIFSTTTTTPVLEAEKARLVQALPAIMAACLARASPAKSSPSYNLLVNFASLLEGYVRWDKKYLERERERETRYSSSGRAYQAPSSSYARVTDILCRCAQPASQTVYLERW